MKITCTKENLNKSLELVSHIASKSTNLPILNNVLLRAKNGVLELISTDLEIGIKSQFRGKIEQEGDFTLPANLFSNYVGLLDKERITLLLKDKEIIIQTDDSTTKIKGQDVDEFPLLPEIKKDKKILISVPELRRAISRVVFACAQDETRPEISGVFIKIENNMLILAATDSYRLAEARIKLSHSAPEGLSVIVPTKTLQELLRVISLGQSDELEVYLNETQILFVYEETELISRIIEGQYPDYTQLIPKDFKTKSVVESKELIKTVKTASLFTKSGINDISFSFSPKEGNLVVEAINNQLGENVAKIKAKVEGQENKIVFNYRYILDGLGAIDASQVELSVIDSTSPGLFKSVEDDGYLYIIMPIRQ